MISTHLWVYKVTLRDDVQMWNGIVKRRPITVECVEDSQQCEHFNWSVFNCLKIRQFWHKEWNEWRYDRWSSSIRPELWLSSILNLCEWIFAVLSRCIERSWRRRCQWVDTTFTCTARVCVLLNGSIVDCMLLNPNACVACEEFKNNFFCFKNLSDFSYQLEFQCLCQFLIGRSQAVSTVLLLDKPSLCTAGHDHRWEIEVCASFHPEKNKFSLVKFWCPGSVRSLLPCWS